jgi:hypothetical protein
MSLILIILSVSNKVHPCPITAGQESGDADAGEDADKGIMGQDKTSCDCDHPKLGESNQW